MAYQQIDLTAIEQAIAGGYTTIRYADGRQISYRSIAELKSIKAIITKSLNQTTASRPAPFIQQSSKGL